MRPQSGEPGTRQHEQARLVREELGRLLSSRAFKTSERCRHFLRFVVEQSLAGRFESLHERNLGHEIFGRPSDYDTGLDSIVRVKANDIRRHLAQAYVETGAPLGVRIDLPPGSYAAQFVLLPAPEPPQKPLRRRSYLLAAPVAIAVCALLVWRTLPSAAPADRFWSPFLRNPKPALICSGSPVVYGLSGRVHKLFRDAHPDLPPGPYVIAGLAPEKITGADVVAVADQYVGIGDSLASGHIAVLFSRLKKPAQRRIASDVSFTDLRTCPTVLIGAFSNRWTLQMTANLPLVFETLPGGARAVRERSAPFRSWSPPALRPDGRTAEDYALVSRIFESQTGQPLLALAGITQYGTQTAGEFVADPAALSEALRGAPPGWQGKNVQFLLHLQVIGKTPSRPRVVAARFW